MPPLDETHLRLSPNYDFRALSVQYLILHYTGMTSAVAAIDHMRNPQSKVSAHYCIDESGTVYQLVSESFRAWHAGVASWEGVTDINGASIGIELVNCGHEHGYTEFPDVQIQACKALSLDIMKRHHILPQYVLGHSDIAPTRKQDPGEKFPWQDMANAGIGLWPEVTDKTKQHQNWSEMLSMYGYDVTDIKAATVAFHRHFYPEFLKDTPNDTSFKRLQALLEALLDHAPESA